MGGTSTLLYVDHGELVRASGDHQSIKRDEALFF